MLRRIFAIVAMLSWAAAGAETTTAKADIGDMEAASVVVIKFELASWKLVSQNTGQLLQHITPAIVNRAVSGEW